MEVRSLDLMEKINVGFTRKGVSVRDMRVERETGARVAFGM